jgi:type II secretory pathway pseudopilin PulG
METLVVMIIAGFVLAIALPAFNRMLASMRADGAVETFAAYVQLAKSEAVKRNQRVGVSIDVGAGNYTLFKDENSSGALDEGEEILHDIYLPGGVDFSSDTEATNIEVAVYTPIGRLLSTPVDPVPASYTLQGPLVTLFDQFGETHVFRLHPNGLVEISS